ncbi:MAG: GNAT family N-acetyltransferase [Deltaproteobacteria bacterium]|nr:GNAT family N-acetyltransferase [Deltaproteobacteria bacterium]
MRVAHSPLARLFLRPALVVALALVPLAAAARTPTPLRTEVPAGYRPAERATEAMVGKLVGLDQRCFPQADWYGARTWQSLVPVTHVLLTADGRGFAAAIAACAIGTAPSWLRDSLAGGGLRDSRATYIASIAVDPAHQRKGLAACLMQMQQIVPSNRDAYLHVRKGNDPAIALYRRLGFEIVEELGAGAVYHDEAALLMRRLALPGKQN